MSFLFADPFDIEIPKWKNIKKRIKRNNPTNLAGVVQIVLPNYKTKALYPTDGASLDIILKITLLIPKAPRTDNIKEWLLDLAKKQISATSGDART